MPETLVNYVTSHERFSVSGEKKRGEGADFVHENSNKTTKSFLSPGMPTAGTWRRVCRKATDLSKLKENALGNVKKSSKRCKKHDNEVTMMRLEIRSCQFIKMSPQHSPDIISMDGQQLDSELCDFRCNANLNYENYKKQLKTLGKFGFEIMKPVFITLKEREMKTKTKSYIIAEIKKILNKMPLQETVGEFEHELEKGEILKKNELKDIFYEVEQRFNEESAAVSVETTTEEYEENV